MSIDRDFKLEQFEKYYGEIEDIKKMLNDCTVCGSKLILSHMSDYTNFIIKETSRCTECGKKNITTIHILN
ncbi:MAG: hypothetical protein ISR65_15290 [Bacteriovoracaceae bacterium]|nr:hypothetical protein [Bacteriovoracaceae bacterium]